MCNVFMSRTCDVICAADHVGRFTRSSPPFLDTASNQKLELGKAWECPYKNDKVAQACDMVVTSLYTRNMLSTTLFPGYDNLVKPCHKRVSLYKVVTSCHKTLHKFETNCYKTCFFFFLLLLLLPGTCM